MKSSDAQQIPYGHYCLYCYAPMERSKAACVHCEQCGQVLVRGDRETRWTLEPRFVRLENVLIIVIWSMCVLVLARSFLGDLGFGLGYIVALPTVGGFLHVTAAKLTHRYAGVRFDLLWAIAMPAFVMIPLMVLIGLLVENTRHLREPSQPDPEWLDLLESAGPYIVGIPLLLSPFATYWFAGRIERWKARYVCSRMGAVPASS